MEQHLSCTPHEFARYLLAALQMFAERRKAFEAALAREQAYYLRELRQWERLSDTFLLRDVRTPHKSAQDDGLDSGGSLRAGDFASWPVFEAPPGLRSSTDYHQISREDWAELPPSDRSQAYYRGRARRQRNRRFMNKCRGRSAQSGQNASYQ